MSRLIGEANNNNDLFPRKVSIAIIFSSLFCVSLLNVLRYLSRPVDKNLNTLKEEMLIYGLGLKAYTTQF